MSEEQIILLKPTLMDILSLPITAYILIGVFVILVALMVALLVLQIRHHVRMSKYAEPVYKRAIGKAEKRANEILWKAMQQARTMRVESELAGIKSVAQGKTEVHKIFEQYKEEMDALSAELKEQFERQNTETEKSYRELLDNFSNKITEDVEDITAQAKNARTRLVTTLDVLEEEAQKARSQYEEITSRMAQQAGQQLQTAEEKMDKELARFHESVITLVDSVQKQSKEIIERRITEEFKATEESIAAYRVKRQALIDNQMLALVEQVAEVALQKHLDLSEHAELVERALAQAKQDGVFKPSESKS